MEHVAKTNLCKSEIIFICGGKYPDYSSCTFHQSWGGYVGDCKFEVDEGPAGNFCVCEDAQKATQQDTTQFVCDAAKTGRLDCTKPNKANIPKSRSDYRPKTVFVVSTHSAVDGTIIRGIYVDYAVAYEAWNELKEAIKQYETLRPIKEYDLV